MRVVRSLVLPGTYSMASRLAVVEPPRSRRASAVTIEPLAVLSTVAERVGFTVCSALRLSPVVPVELRVISTRRSSKRLMLEASRASARNSTR